jgi:hypothetical protein
MDPLRDSIRFPIRGCVDSNFIRRLVFTATILFLSTVISCNVEHDMQDARSAAARIHSQLQSGDYASIYRESSSSFKAVGDENEFVSSMQEFYQLTGKFIKAQEGSYASGVDSEAGRTYTLNFLITYEHGDGRERLVFTRSRNGTMQLWNYDIDPKD